MAAYSSPLAPYTSDPNYAPLPTDDFNPDGKSLVNPPRTGLSPAYEIFPEPIISSNNGFDFHGAFCFTLISPLRCGGELPGARQLFVATHGTPYRRLSQGPFLPSFQGSGLSTS
jgi:hypothetical protein